MLGQVVLRLVPIVSDRYLLSWKFSRRDMNTFIDTSKSVIPTIPSVHGTSILGVVNQNFFLCCLYL